MNKDSDGHKENLSKDAAVDKIRELAKSARTCLFGTMHGGFPLNVRPMAVGSVDAAGNFWFLSGRSTEKNTHIRKDPRVQLLFANAGDSEYMSLQGTASISDDRALKEKYWSTLAKAWFPGGVDDPELTVIKFEPTDGHYWDTEHGKAVALAKILVSSLTGKPLNEGVEGRVKP